MFLVYLDVIAPLIAVLFILAIKRARFAGSDLVLLIFLLSQVIQNGTGNLLQYFKINNHWIYHTNCFFTQVIFTYYFYQMVITEKRVRKMILVTFTLFVLFFLFNLLYLQSYRSFNSYSYSLGSFLFCVYTYYGFEKLMHYTTGDDIFDLKLFWALSAILIYFGSALLIFLSYNYLSVVSYFNVGVLWRLHNVFLAIGSFLFFKSVQSKIWIPG